MSTESPEQKKILDKAADAMATEIDSDNPNPANAFIIGLKAMRKVGLLKFINKIEGENR
jgi:hypothetical protein